MRQTEEKMLGKIVGSVEVSLMLNMLTLFRNDIKRRVNFAPMDKALVFIIKNLNSGHLLTRRCPPQMEPLLAISIFYMLVMTISSAKFSRN